MAVEDMDVPPPPYEDAQPVASSSTSYSRADEKKSQSTHPTASPSQYLPSSSSRPGRPISLSKSPTTSPETKKAFSWFRSAPVSHKVHEEMASTVKGLIRDLIRPGHSDIPDPQSVLQSCADACHSYSLSFSDILQDKCIERHTAFYWSIINCSRNSDVFDLIAAMLYFAAPLTPSTISEIRSACLQQDDQALFQRIRLTPEFASMSGTDQMLLGHSMAPDNITVETSPSDDLSFAVNFEIARFQKRMEVSKEVVLEFIAKNRCWRVVFSVEEGNAAWSLTLSLLEASPATFINGQLLIQDSSVQPQALAAPSQGTFVNDRKHPSGLLLDDSNSLAPRPPLRVALRMGRSQLSPAGAHSQGNQSPEALRVELDHQLVSSSLRKSRNSYLSEDDVLRARLEARLARPEVECTIC